MNRESLTPRFVEVLPDTSAIKAGEVWITHKHRTVNLRCPCGCGKLTVLSLHPSRWHVHFNGKSVSLDGPTGGSVWTTSACGSHYLIRNNAVIWLDRIDPSLHSEYAELERARMLGTTACRVTLRWRMRCLLRALLKRIWRK